jgi:hypothetical protein
LLVEAVVVPPLEHIPTPELVLVELVVIATLPVTIFK